MANWRKFYVPGIISLIGLPFLAFFFVPEPKPSLTAIKLFLPYEGKADKNMVRFSKEEFLKSIRRKKIISIDIGSEYYGDENYMLYAKMKLINREMERLRFTGDSTSVLRVQFDDSLSYGHLIWLINQTLIYDIRQWAFFDHSFYFVFPPRSFQST